jgi:hypothetical protein
MNKNKRTNEEVAELVADRVCRKYCKLNYHNCPIWELFKENLKEDILMSDEYGWGCIMLGRFEDLLRKPRGEW